MHDLSARRVDEPSGKPYGYDFPLSGSGALHEGPPGFRIRRFRTVSFQAIMSLRLSSIEPSAVVLSFGDTQS